MKKRAIMGRAFLTTVCFTFGLVGTQFSGTLVSGTIGDAGFWGSQAAYAQSGGVSKIVVEGNRRVEPETVRSYLAFKPGDSYDAEKLDSSMKALYGTGLFADVSIRKSGSVVYVKVIENPIINQVAFEGNKEVEDDTLKTEVQLKPRDVYTRARVQSDVQRILDVYHRQGLYAASVEPKIIKLQNDRIDLVYEIQEGPSTKVKNINFIGNKAFSDGQLRDVITTTETNWLSFLKPTDVYDPDRMNVDREKLRLFYLQNGYADVRVVSAIADLDREGKGFYLTFTVEEGEKYTFGNINVETSLAGVEPDALKSYVLTKAGDKYNATLIDKTIEEITLEASKRGFAFARVRPQVNRDPVAKTIGLSYVIEQGPRVYIERINIYGNVRTFDYVIRREFTVAEGDAYNKLIVDNARRRLMGLGLFKKVDINRENGSAPDRVVLSVNVVEQPTGEVSLGGGYSTADGVIADISYTERNFMGRGQFLKVSLSGSLEGRLQGQLSFTEPKFMDRDLAAGFDIFHKQVDYSKEASYESQSTGGKIRLSMPLMENVRLGTYYSFVQDKITIDPDGGKTPSLAVQRAEGTSNVSSVGYSLTLDKRNHPQNPTDGYFVELTQDFAGVGGDVQYIRTQGDARAYYSIAKDWTLVGRAAGGIITGWGDEDVRLLDHFYNNSANGVRGFKRAGYGPRDADTGDALGGTIYWVATTELRYPFPWLTEELGISGAVFADVGSIFNAEGVQGVDVVGDDKSLRASVGTSILWASPLGPLRFDFAYALSSVEDVDKEQVFQFGASAKF